MLCARHSQPFGPASAGRPGPSQGACFRQLRHCSQVTRAEKGDNSNKSDDKADPNKADFSAYWALKFKNLFSKRREYLEGASFKETGVPIIKEYQEKVEAEIEEQRLQIAKASEQYRTRQEKLNEVQAARSQQVYSAVDAQLQKTLPLSPELRQAIQAGAVGQVLSSEEVVVQDITMARQSVHSARFKAFVLAILEFRELVRKLVMAPITLPLELHRRWSTIFASQRYQNFLMAEGTRVWYWRNRQENERWFWETMFFDRIVAPVAWTLCYMYIVPDNFLWGVMVPLTLIYWQTGSLPAPISLEGGLIAYLGFYQKSWPQVQAFLAALFQWW